MVVNGTAEGLQPVRWEDSLEADAREYATKWEVLQCGAEFPTSHVSGTLTLAGN